MRELWEAGGPSAQGCAWHVRAQPTWEVKACRHPHPTRRPDLIRGRLGVRLFLLFPVPPPHPPVGRSKSIRAPLQTLLPRDFRGSRLGSRPASSPLLRPGQLSELGTLQRTRPCGSGVRHTVSQEPGRVGPGGCRAASRSQELNGIKTSHSVEESKVKGQGASGEM